MTPAQAMKAIESVLAQDATKMSKAMSLYALGLSRSEAAELVPMNYSQAHTAWMKYHDGNPPEPAPRVRAGKASVPELRPNDDGSRRLSNRRALFLTPSQTRYITQDGHEVVRVDRSSGAFCLACDKLVQFDLKWLGFVHKFSTSEPTDMEDRYVD